MARVIRIDDEIMDELRKKAIELNLIFSTPNEVLRKILFDQKESPHVHEFESSAITESNEISYPRSQTSNLQVILDSLKNTILAISPRGLKYFSSINRWVANPNIVAITVQDARAQNIAITIYGHPEDFRHLANNIVIKQDRPSYSRFTIKNVDQIDTAIRIIKHSYELKQ